MNVEKMTAAAKVIVEDCLAVQEGEKVLLVTDDGIGTAYGMRELGDSIIRVMNEKNLDPCVVSYKARLSEGGDIPALAETCCMDADVIISLNTSSILYSSIFPKIYQGGTTNRRILLLPPGLDIGDDDFLERVMPQTREELYDMADVTKKFGEMFRDGKEHTVHLTAKNGTDLTLSAGKLGGVIQGGICTQPGAGQVLPSGSLALGVNEGTAEGVLVADNCHSLEKRFLEEPMTFTISKGYVQSMDDGVETKKFLAEADTHPGKPEEKFSVAEFGLGFNPKAKLTGSVPEGELVRGAAHVALGSNITFGGSVCIPGWHVDFIEPEATVELDGKMILKDGEYLV